VQILKWLVDLDEILYGGDEIQNYLYSILNPIASFQNGRHLNFCLVNFHEIWLGRNDIQEDLDAIIINPIASIILNLLLFNFFRWAFLNSGFGLFMFHGNHDNQFVYCKLM
jgi:hypothetical protein